MARSRNYVSWSAHDIGNNRGFRLSATSDTRSCVLKNSIEAVAKNALNFCSRTLLQLDCFCSHW